MKERRHIITRESNMLAPSWLADRINYKTIKFLYVLVDGAEALKGLKINGQIAEIGDAVVLADDRIVVEKNDR